MVQYHEKYRDTELEVKGAGRGHRFRLAGEKEYLTGVRSVTDKVMDRSGPMMAYARREMEERVVDSLGRFMFGEPLNDGDYLEIQMTDVKRLVADAKKQDMTAVQDGGELHRAIKGYLEGTDSDHDNDVWARIAPAFGAAMQYLEDKDLQPVACEYNVWHPLFHYAGRMDLLAQDKDGAYWVIDWKMANGVYTSDELQVAAYSRAFDWLLFGGPSKPVARAAIVQLPNEKNGLETYREVEVTEIAEAFDLFLGAYDVVLGWKKYEKVMKASREKADS